MKKALIIVDIQNDFCENGSLAVPSSNEILDRVNSLMRSGNYDLIVATMDWHPENHSSFIVNNEKGIWPIHCVQGSKGSNLHCKIDKQFIDEYIYKGTNPEVDSYSGFFDNDQKSQTGLNDLLKLNNVNEVDIVGLALDYCVKATALDAKKLGYKTNLVEDCTKAVNLSPNDGLNAIQEMKNADVLIK